MTMCQAVNILYRDGIVRPHGGGVPYLISDGFRYFFHYVCFLPPEPPGVVSKQTSTHFGLSSDKSLQKVSQLRYVGTQKTSQCCPMMRDVFIGYILLEQSPHKTAWVWSYMMRKAAPSKRMIVRTFHRNGWSKVITGRVIGDNLCVAADMSTGDSRGWVDACCIICIDVDHWEKHHGRCPTMIALIRNMMDVFPDSSSFRQIMCGRWPPSLDWRVVSSVCDLLQPVRTVMSLIVPTVWWCCRCIVVVASRVFALFPRRSTLLLLFSLSAAMISAKMSKVWKFAFANVPK